MVWSERAVIRFGTTLAANLLRAGFSVTSGILIARGLGASGYGDLSFLLGSFAAISQLLEMGTSSAFYTFISQCRRSRAFFSLYLGWIALQFTATTLAVGLLLPGALIERIWIGHNRGVVLLAFAASFLTTQAWGVVSQLGEATRRTVVVQAAVVAQAVVHLTLISTSVYLGWLTVQTVMWLLVGEFALLAVIFGPKLLRENLATQAAASELHTIVRDFAAYCRPLVVYGWMGFLYTFADAWLLQRFGGAEQQGFFAIAQQLANVALLVTTSVLKVFWKEIAEARERQDLPRMKKLYTSVSRGLYFFSAWTSCLLISYSHEILGWTMGTGYEAAWLALGVMFLYPIHQSLGQIAGTFFYASGQTGNYTRIGLVMMGVSIPVTYLTLATPSAMVPGLGLGAVGLAAKMVVLQVIGVNLQMYVIARSHGWDYDSRYQGIVLGLLLGLGVICKWASLEIFQFGGAVGSPAGVMLLGGLFYTVLSLGILYRAPGLAGLARGEIMWTLRDTARWLRPTVMEGPKNNY